MATGIQHLSPTLVFARSLSPFKQYSLHGSVFILKLTLIGCLINRVTTHV